MGMADCRNCVFCKEIWKDDAYNCLQNLRLPFFNIVEVNECTKYLSALKWIPVSERLPEEDGDYLTTCRCMGVRFYEVLSFAKDGEAVDYYDLTAKQNVWYEYLSEYGYVSRTNVTHWMPLPEPPQEEDK